MAHHKRSKSRSRSGSIRVSREVLSRRKHTKRTNRYSLGRPPAWYAIIFLKRPFRRKNKAVCDAAMSRHDLDDLEYPVSRRSSSLYW